MKTKKQKGSQFRKTWSYVYPYFRKYRKGFAGVLLLSGAASVFEPVLAFAAKPVIDFALKNPEAGKRILWMIPVGIVVLFVFRGAVVFAYKYTLARLCIKAVRDIQISLYRHFMFLSLDHFEKTSTGEMMSRTVNDVGYMQQIVPVTIDSFHQIVQLAGLMAVCFYREPRLSALVVLTFPPIVYIVRRISFTMKRYTKSRLSRIAGITRIMQETYSGLRVVKAFARESREVERYRNEVNQYLGVVYKYTAVKETISPLVEFVSALALSPIIYYLCRRVIYGGIQGPEVAGNIISYILALGLMYKPINKLGQISGEFNSIYGAAERIRETFEKKSSVTEIPGAIELAPLRDSIRYENVKFRYEHNLVLNGFSLEIKKGELVALVGVSGVGKTTIVNILPRFYDIEGGQILIDGVDIRQVTLKSLRMQIGVVTQETFLFNDTVGNNILYGSEGKTREEMFEATRVANAHEFIMRLDHGYQSMVGERGVRLSGGERQRIAIARALLKDPPILILDEATSALDTAAEIKVHQALDYLMKNRTVIAVAHRLSTIRHANKIVVIEDGRVREAGTHHELMEFGGEYKKLYEMQFFLGEYAKDRYRRKG